MTSYRIIEGLKRTDRVLYRQIVTCSPRTSTRSMYSVNDLLRITQSYVHPLTGVRAQHWHNIRGVLKLVRDCWHHPTVDVDEDKLIIVIHDDFPRLLRDQHKALSRAGLLGRLKLEATMSTLIDSPSAVEP